MPYDPHTPPLAYALESASGCCPTYTVTIQYVKPSSVPTDLFLTDKQRRLADTSRSPSPRRRFPVPGRIKHNGHR